ncbi:hypothetical protein FisN_8Lh253 [Fistulifera solaris]|uniref:HMG box domain-containing protein n=1 Tax=Fistulifera solaris TaxID=1519565 RepID=A0A1Z5JN57_FISSO|nr:hypothetical protein FisN_8Lh253 [Fistulifera solaris]|eukprot:GAX15447.1 hypothetical protein FisN_8Lh253 [Fistulifera solaris]
MEHTTINTSNPTNGKDSGKAVKQRKEKKPVATSKQRQPTKNEKPSRPLSAYNVFFKEERVKWLAESSHNTQQKFTQMGYEMGQRWKKLSAAEKLKYEKIAQEDVKRYQKEMEQYEKKASPKKASKTKSPQKAPKETKKEVEKAPVATAPSSSDAARRVVNVPSPAIRDPQELMIQQLLASQQGVPLGQQQPQIPIQLHEREAILRQLQLQELASRSQLSQLVPGNPLMGYPTNQYLGALSGGGAMLPGLEQQLLIQRLRDQELRSQIASLERGLTAQPFAPLSNLDLLALQASSQPQPPSLSDSELLANMSVREKLQLLMQLNQQGF